MNNINQTNFIQNVHFLSKRTNVQQNGILSPLKCDTVSFSGVSNDFLKGYDEVLIYDKSFNKTYNDPQFREKKGDYDKWLEKLRNHQVPKNVCHDCSKQDADAFGLYEIAPSGKSNPERLYYKVLGGKLIVLCCGDKNTQTFDISKAKKIAKDEKLLKAFIAEKSAEFSENQAQRASENKKHSAATEKQANIEQAKQKQQASIWAGFDLLISEAKEDIENSQMSSLKTFKEQLSEAAEEYPDDTEIPAAIENVDKSIEELQKALNDLQVEKDDTNESVDNRILDTMIFAENCKTKCYGDVVVPLLQKVDNLRLQNLSNIIEIRETYESIKHQFKDMQAESRKQNAEKGSNIIFFLKNYNSQVRRKAEIVIGDKEKLDELDNLSLKESTDKLDKIRVLKVAGDEIYDSFSQSVNYAKSMSKHSSQESESVVKLKVKETKQKKNVQKTEHPAPAPNSEVAQNGNYSALSGIVEALQIEKEVPEITPEDKQLLQSTIKSLLEDVDLSDVNGEKFADLMESVKNNPTLKTTLDKYKKVSKPQSEPVQNETAQEDKIEDLMDEYENSVFLKKAVDKVLTKLMSQCHVADVNGLKQRYISSFKKDELVQADINKETKVLVEKAKVLKQALKSEAIHREALMRLEHENEIRNAQNAQDRLFEVLNTPKKSAEDSALAIDKMLNEQEEEKLSELDDLLDDLI